MPGRLDRNTVRKQITSIIEEKKTSLCNGQPTITHIANTFANYELLQVVFIYVSYPRITKTEQCEPETKNVNDTRCFNKI